MENINATTMTTEMAFDAMEQLLPHIAEVLGDVEIRQMVELAKADGGKNTPAKDLLTAMLPLFVTRHRDNMLHIVAAMKGVTVEEARGMLFADTLETLRGSFVEEMLLFFMLCLRMVSVL